MPSPKTYSRGRSVVYREILRAPLTDPDALLEVGIFFPGPTDLSAGTACVVGGTPPPGSALLRDPWPHDLFSFDGTLAFYGGDDGGVIAHQGQRHDRRQPWGPQILHADHQAERTSPSARSEAPCRSRFR